MKDFITQLMFAVITAAVPVLTVYFVRFIGAMKDKALAQTDSTKQQWYIEEAAQAVSEAVSAVNQTFVDALKKAGTFDLAAQKEAAQKALAAALASISPAAKEFIEHLYGDLTEYLSTKIEAEVRRQKVEAPAPSLVPAELSSTNTETVAATTAAATVAAIAQAPGHTVDTPATE